jgi:hypothetical protein
MSQGESTFNTVAELTTHMTRWSALDIIIAIFAVVKLGLRPLHEELLKNTMEGSHFHANCLDFKYLSKRLTTRPQLRFIKAFEKESYGQASDQQLYLSPTNISFSLSVR